MKLTDLELMFLKCAGYEIDQQNGTVTICGLEKKEGTVRDYVDKQPIITQYFKSGDNSFSFFDPHEENQFSTVSKDNGILYLISSNFSPWLISISSKRKNDKPTIVIRAADNKNGKALSNKMCSHITIRFDFIRTLDNYLSVDVSSAGDGFNKSHRISCSPLGISYNYGVINSHSEKLTSEIFAKYLYIATFQRGSSSNITYLLANKFKHLYYFIYEMMVKDMIEHSDGLFECLDMMLKDLDERYKGIGNPESSTAQHLEDKYSAKKEQIEEAIALLEGLNRENYHME